MSQNRRVADGQDDEWEGVWWLPDSPSHRSPGTLVDTGTHIELVLHGSDLTPPVEVVQHGPISIPEPQWEVAPIVHGRLRDRRSVTLLNAGGTHLRGPFQAEVQVYRVEVALLGGHVDRNAFIEMRVEFDWLDAWLDPGPILDPTRSRDASALRENATEIARFTIGATQLVFKTGVVGTSGEASIHLDRWSALVVELDQPQGWKDLVEAWLRPIQDLLVVSLGRSVQMTWLHFRPPGATEYEQALEARFHILQRTPPNRDRRSSKNRAILHNYTEPTLAVGRDPDISLEELVVGWVAIWPSYKPLIASLLGHLYAPFMYSTQKYGAIFQTLEGISARKHPGPEKVKAEHQARVKSIVDASTAAGVDEEVVNWAARILATRNDKTLAARISEVLMLTGELGRAILDADPSFGKNAAGFRGSVAHPRGKKGIDYARQHWYGEVMSWVARCILLQDAGLSSAAQRALKKTPFQHALNELEQRSEDASVAPVAPVIAVTHAPDVASAGGGRIQSFREGVKNVGNQVVERKKWWTRLVRRQKS